MFESRVRKTNSFRSPADASIQKKQGSSAGIGYQDNRPIKVTQMESDIKIVQRKLIMTGDFNIDFDETTEDTEIMEFAEFLIEEDWQYDDKGFSKQEIFVALRRLANEGDHSMSEHQLQDYIFSTKVNDSVGNKNKEKHITDLDSFDEDDALSDSIKIGKRLFDRDTWHHAVKQTIITTIGVKELSLLAYKDSKHHNFDFWIGKDGRIWVGGNNTGGHEVPTDYLLTMDDKVVKG